jgi:hypothetical protein
MLKVGDRVTLSCNPTILITQYDRLKPFASVSREIAEDVSVQEQMTELREDVYALTYLSTIMEIEVMLKMGRQLEKAGDDFVELYAYLKEKVNDAEIGIVKEEKDSAPRGKKAVKRKADAKAVRKKAVRKRG